MKTIIIMCKSSILYLSALSLFCIGFVRAWGLSAIYAYRAYGETQFLHLAQDVWKTVNACVITPGVGLFSTLRTTCHNGEQ